MQEAVTTLPETQARPPAAAGKSMYHQVPSLLLPDTVALAPWLREPTILYTVPGPERTLTALFATAVGVHGVADGATVSVMMGAVVDVPVGVIVLSICPIGTEPVGV